MSTQAHTYEDLHKACQFQYGRSFIDGLSFSPDACVLDIGCGTGDLAAYVAAEKVSNGNVTAFDPDSGRLNVAVQKYGHVHNTMFHNQDAISFLKDKVAEYDVIYSNVVLHWLPLEQREDVFKYMMQALKPGGYCAHQVATEVVNLTQLKKSLSVKERDDLDAFLILFTADNFRKFAVDAGFIVESLESLTRSGHFKDINEYMDFMQATYQEKVPFRKCYFEKLPEHDIEIQQNGEVIHVTHLLSGIFRKAF